MKRVFKLKLTRLKKLPGLATLFAGKYVRIFTGDGHLYWRPNANGYTSDKPHAGVYLFEDALKRSHHAGPEKKIEYHALEIDEAKIFFLEQALDAQEAELKRLRAENRELRRAA